MRDIKFRAWLTDRMVYNVGFHPYMSVNLVAAEVAEKDEFQNRDEQFIWSPGLCEMMQYTGLKDKNGVEIYEGDIVKIHAGHQDKLNLIYLVDFKDGSFGLKIPNSKDIGDFSSFIYYNQRLYENGYKEDCQLYMEVIGNTHTTPELLTH